MKTNMIAGILTAMCFMSAGVTAQQSRPAETVQCSTSDGIVTISGDTILFRNYVFTSQSTVKDKMIQLIDTKSGATAILDARNSAVVFLNITEGGVKMHVAANRDDITVQQMQSTDPARRLSAKRMNPGNAGPLVSMLMR